MTDIRHRLLTAPQVRKVSEEERVIEFVASDNSVDSYGTVLDVSGWNLERYNKNGIVGYQHDVYGSDDPDNVIGKGEARIEDDQLLLRVTFEPADLNEKADKIYRKVLFGTLNGVSVGFSASDGHWGEEERGENPDVYYYTAMELLEVSVVNIPSNANAVKRSIEEEQEELRKKSKCKNEDEDEEREEKEEDKIENEPEDRSADSELNIRLTTARAKALLAQNHHKK